MQKLHGIAFAAQYFTVSHLQLSTSYAGHARHAGYDIDQEFLSGDFLDDMYDD